MVSAEKVQSVAACADKHGTEKAAEILGISVASVKRYLRMAFTEHSDEFSDKELREFRIFRERFSEDERKAILAGSRIRHDAVQEVVRFDSDVVTVGFFTDPHWGAKHSPRHYWDSFLEECTRTGVDLILCAGDLIEGMSNRPDQVYSLSHVGWSAQMEYAVELLHDAKDFTIYGIDGNHDGWGIKNGGLFVGKELAKQVPHFKFCGHHSGTVDINGTKWMLVHGMDAGGAYAVSWRLQKMIEAFTGGQKPNVLLAGHDHKHCYLFERNVHAVAGGALCMQSEWMKATRKANKDGFHIIRAGITDGEIKWFEPRWYPFYN